MVTLYLNKVDPFPFNMPQTSLILHFLSHIFKLAPSIKILWQYEQVVAIMTAKRLHSYCYLLNKVGNTDHTILPILYNGPLGR